MEIKEKTLKYISLLRNQKNLNKISQKQQKV